MKRYFGYIRVSTAKQGTHGVSLIEQKAAIERYAAKGGLNLAEWFEERETAAKRGRPVFARMLAQLRAAKASGVVIHKIDRSARNLRDWADLGELIDSGVEVHFAADALDLNSRGGRLSADIQAVVAADYIRNLREETRKGFYGRLKQGLYPLKAPIGYADQGGGRAKTPHPIEAPHVRRAFELYASGRFTLQSLCAELERVGFTRRSGRPHSRSTLAYILHNPFYAGTIRLSSGETFNGIHEPLVPLALYDRVQRMLSGRLAPRSTFHDFRYRRLFTCGLCGAALVGERQKGNVYYRCHSRDCAGSSIREEKLDEAVVSTLHDISILPADVPHVRAYLEREDGDAEGERVLSALRLQQVNAKSRMERLTDALIDGALEKEAFNERRASLLEEIARVEAEISERSARLELSGTLITETLELAENLILSYETADDVQKREIVKTISSNRAVCGKKAAITLQNLFEDLKNRPVV